MGYIICAGLMISGLGTFRIEDIELGSCDSEWCASDLDLQVADLNWTFLIGSQVKWISLLKKQLKFRKRKGIRPMTDHSIVETNQMHWINRMELDLGLLSDQS